MIARLRKVGWQETEEHQYDFASLANLMLTVADMAKAAVRTVEVTDENGKFMFHIGYTGFVQWDRKFRQEWVTATASQPPMAAGTVVMLEDAEGEEWLPYGSWTDIFKQATQMARDADKQVIIKRMPHGKVLCYVTRHGEPLWQDTDAMRAAIASGWGGPKKNTLREVEMLRTRKHDEVWSNYSARAWRPLVYQAISIAKEQEKAGIEEVVAVRDAATKRDIFEINIGHAIRWYDDNASSEWLAEHKTSEVVYHFDRERNGDDPEVFFLSEYDLNPNGPRHIQWRWREIAAQAEKLADRFKRIANIYSPVAEKDIAASHGCGVPLQYLSHEIFDKFGSVPAVMAPSVPEDAAEEFAVTSGSATVVEVRWENHETSTAGMRVMRSDDGKFVTVSFLGRRSGNWGAARQIPAGAWSAIGSALK